MLISLNDALKRAKDNGATENPGLFIRATVLPRWFGWILSKFPSFFGIELEVTFGEIKDGHLIQKGSSTWTTK